MDKNRLLKSDCARLGILMGLCLALGIYLIATTVLISKDGVFYIGQAQNLARDPLGVAQRHPPGYPVLLWIAHEIANLFVKSDSISSWVHVSQSVTLVCRLLALIPLYLLSKSLIGGARAFWAVLILIVLPYPAQYGSDVLRDWPYVMFLSFGLWLLYEALRRRTWWMFALVGLDAAAGYLIQPAAAQLVLCGLLGLAIALRRDARFCVSTEGRGPLMAAVLLIGSFAAPVLPYTCATGTLIPHQLRPSTFNSPPVITSIGGKGAGRDPLEFEVREGDLLEIGVEAFDAQSDELTFSPAAVAVGSRPVYQFRLTTSGDRFMTISEDEKNTLLEMYPPGVREYDGIVYYAYAQADVRPGLEPVHRLWSPVRQRHFYTIHLSEKDAVLAQAPNDAWTYEGIAFYVFAQGRQPPDAVPVHRLRSEGTGYSWAVTEKENIGTVPNNDAADEGVAWYVHVAGQPPAGMSIQDGTLRWRPGPGQRGEYQIGIVVSDGDMETCQLVRVTVRERATAQELTASRVPARTMDVVPTANRSLGVNRSRPGGIGKAEGFADGERGNHRQAACLFSLERHSPGRHGQTRLPVGRGEGILPLHCGTMAHHIPAKRGQDGLATVRHDQISTVKRVWRCHPAYKKSQAEHIHHRQAAIAAATRPELAYAGADVASVYEAVKYAEVGRLPAAVDRLFDGFTESLMVFFLVPWCVGLYYRMRHDADRLERVLTTAVIVVNVGLMLGRYVWVAPTMERRYCLPLIALTIVYVPVGLERIALWLSRRAVTTDHSEGLAEKRISTWFHVLAIIGIGICLPKLLTPLYAEKESYRKTIQWLRDNTRPEDVSAVPDSRLTFYAQRPGLIYRNEADPRRADYIVRILDRDARTAPPTDWSQEYSVPINDRRGRTLVIYKTNRRKS